MSLDSFMVSDTDAISMARCDSVPELMIIAGANGVGKSTVLESIFKFPDSKFNGDTDRSYFGPHRAPSGNRVRERDLLDMEDVPTRKVASKTNQRPGSERANRSIGGPGDINRTNPRKETDTLPYYEVQRRIAQLQYNKRDIISRLYERQNEVKSGDFPDIEEPLRDVVSRVLPGLSFMGVEKDNHIYNINFRNSDGEEVEFHDLSSGEKDLISLLFLCVEHEIHEKLAAKGLRDYDRDDLVIIIDGPESYLHPRLQINFIDYIRGFVHQYDGEKSIQYIICTHSRTILESAKRNELYYLLSSDKVSDNQLKRSDELSTETLDRITYELAPALLSSGQNILLVEGSTDRDVFHYIYPTLEDETDIVRMEGKDSIINTTLNNIVPKLRSKGVDVYGIVDRDRDLSLDARIDDNFHQLSCTCIENLLLDKEAVYEALKKPIVGPSKLEDVGVYDSSDIEVGIEYIISRPSFIRHEVRKRWNDHVNPIYLNLKNFRSSSFENLTNYATNIVTKVIKRASSKNKNPNDIHSDVRRLVKYKKYDELDGKYILGQIASYFDVDRDELARHISAEMEPQDLRSTTHSFITNTVLG